MKANEVRHVITDETVGTSIIVVGTNVNDIKS
jgi:hypothetical protein